MEVELIFYAKTYLLVIVTRINLQGDFELDRLTYSVIDGWCLPQGNEMVT